MTIPTTDSVVEQQLAPAVKPPWRFASERRLGKIARQLLSVAEAEIPWALEVLGSDQALEAARRDGWALACLARAAECDDGSEQQGAWVILAASRPRLVRQTISPSAAPRRRPRRLLTRGRPASSAPGPGALAAGSACLTREGR